MVKDHFIFRLFLVCLAVFLVACTDSKEVNAAFSRTHVSWGVFDAGQPTGISPLLGFEQARKTAWVPRTRGVFATDLVATSAVGVVAVSHLGLLVLDDSSGSLLVHRPRAQWDLAPYETGRLFLWKERIFLTLRQEPPADAPPASLAWWIPGQSRLAFYPVPSQVKDPTRQAVTFVPPSAGVSLLGIQWRRPAGAGWVYEASNLELDAGTETQAPIFSPAVPGTDLDPTFAAVRARLAERVGTGVATRSASGNGVVLVYTESGWVSVGKIGEARSRLYRLPELGPAGRYTGAAALNRGFVFTWETFFRGYSGSAGMVHVPFAVLAP